MALITGNTYPVKDQLRALGGRWDARRRGWEVPEDRATEARALVERPAPKASRNALHPGTKCAGGFGCTREATTMAEDPDKGDGPFPLCGRCAREYADAR